MSGDACGNGYKNKQKKNNNYLATVSKDSFTFWPVAALHSMNPKAYSCGIKM